MNKEKILECIAKADRPISKRDIAKQLNIKADKRVALKQILKALEQDGVIIKHQGKAYSLPHGLPTVSIIQVIDQDIDGELFAKPTEWDTTLQGESPRILIVPEKKGHAALKVGDRILARLSKSGTETDYEARMIRHLDTPQGHVTGVVRITRSGAMLKPVHKKAKNDFEIAQYDLNGAKDGDLAMAEIQPARGLKTKKVRVIEVIGHEEDPRAISLLSLHEMGLRSEFTDKQIHAADNENVPPLKGREDLRKTPLVTIDGADARDFDDAVFAEPWENGGYHIIVAIADVAYYVRPGSDLDKEAFTRGNSTYFPDRVVPMLPEKLSNDLCSLRPKEDRACLAMHMWIDSHGELHSFKIFRGLMHSAARLTYEQVQAARDGIEDDLTGPLKPQINNLFTAYKILDKARQKRGALDLDLPERQIIIDDENRMSGVKQRERLDSHKLIEEFMVLANVAAAKALEAKNAPCIYRIHDAPNPDKIDSVRQFIDSFGLSLPKGQSIRPVQLNRILKEAEKLPYSHLISQVVLRSQSQANYATENIGHYGLALSRYAHFTSPIRRYADLIVHRSLISAYGLGPGGLSEEETVRLDEICGHISTTERVSMEAERNATDRFTGAFLSTQIGASFSGRISGVTRFGLFVTLNESGADGLVPIRSLPDDYYIHDEQQHALIGRRKKRIFRMGAEVQVKLKEANGLSGSTVLEVLNAHKGAEVEGFQRKSAPPLKGFGKKSLNIRENKDRKKTFRKKR